MIRLFEVLVSGVTLGSVYFLVAAGVSVVFGQTRIVNFAHGQFLVVAGMASWDLVLHGVPFVLAAVISVVSVSVLAFVLERTVLRRTASNPFAAFIITLGVLIILQEVSVLLWGPAAQQLQSPIQGAWDIGGVLVPKTDAVLVGMAALMAGALFSVLRLTSFGRQARACAEDADASAHLGVRVNRVASLVFVGGSGLAAVAGCLLAMVYPLGPLDGGTYIIKGFAVALVGGLGSIEGAGLAALALGIIETAGQAYWIPEWVPALSFALIIGVLLVRPSGLFGRVLRSTEAVVSTLPRSVRAPRWSPVALGIAVLLAFLVPQMGLKFETQTLANFAVVYAAQAAAIGLLFRLSGILSFAHGAFFGIGCYLAAYAALNWNLGFWTALPLCFVACAAVGALVAVPIFRTRGLYFLIVTFAITDFAVLIELNLRGITNGSEGLTVLSTPSGFLGLGFDEPKTLYRLLLAGLLLILAVSWLVSRSSFGDRVAAIRDNEALARSFGVNVRGYLIVIFALSAGLSGVAGDLYLYQNSTVAPSLFTGLVTVTFPLMVILGGSRSLAGPAVGAVILTFLPFWLHLDPGPTQIAYGVILIAVMLVMPEGVVPAVYRAAGGATALIGRIRPSTPGVGPAAPPTPASSAAGGADAAVAAGAVPVPEPQAVTSEPV